MQTTKDGNVFFVAVWDDGSLALLGEHPLDSSNPMGKIQEAQESRDQTTSEGEKKAQESTIKELQDQKKLFQQIEMVLKKIADSSAATATATESNKDAAEAAGRSAALDNATVS